jgi:hypothetical protein
MTTREEEAWAALPTVHCAHTACADCVNEMAHVGHKGKCVVCLQALGKARSVVHHAGVALQSPVENVTGTTFIKSSHDARQNLDQFQKEQERKEDADGSRRRADALAGMEARRQAVQSAERATAEVTEILKDVPEEEAAAVMEQTKRAEQLEREIAGKEYERALHEMRRVHDADLEREKKEAQDEAAALKETMQLEAQRMRALAAEEARLMRAKARQEAERVQKMAAEMAAAAQADKAACEEALQAAKEKEAAERVSDAQAAESAAPKKRKRPEVDEEEKLRRKEQAKETARKRKEKLTRFDEIENELDDMHEKYTSMELRQAEIEEIAREHIKLERECHQRSVEVIHDLLVSKANVPDILKTMATLLADTQQKVFAENTSIPFHCGEELAEDGDVSRSKLSFDEHINLLYGTAEKVD